MASLRPTFAQLTEQVRPVAASWEQFAIHLGLDYDTICAIRRDEHGVANQLSCVLDRWLERNPTGTWKDVVNALRSLRWHDLADKTESKYVHGTGTAQNTQHQTVVTDGPSRRLTEDEIEEIKTCIDSVIDKNYSRLNTLFDGGLKSISLELYTAGIITNEVLKEPSFEGIMSCFKAGFAFKLELSEIEEYCRTFFKAFYKVGGPFPGAAEMMKKSIVSTVKTKVSVEMKIAD